MDYEEFAKAFREEEMKERFGSRLVNFVKDKKVKTKHLNRKAEKVKVTRKVKHDKRVTLEHIRIQMVRDVSYNIKSLRQRNAKDCDTVAFINKKYAQIRQIISE